MYFRDRHVMWSYVNAAYLTGFCIKLYSFRFRKVLCGGVWSGALVTVTQHLAQSSHCQPISTILPARLAWLGRPSDHNSGLIFGSELNITIFDHFDLAVTPCDAFWMCPASHWQLKPQSTNFSGLQSGFTVTNLISVSEFSLDEVQVEL